MYGGSFEKKYTRGWKIMKMLMCRESIGYKTFQTTLTLTLPPLPLTFVTFMNLTYDLWLWPTTFVTLTLTSWPWPFLILGWKLEFSHFWLWPWPPNLFEIWWWLMCVLNFGTVGPAVEPAEQSTNRQRDRQTHTHRWTVPKILPSANATSKIFPGGG